MYSDGIDPEEINSVIRVWAFSSGLACPKEVIEEIVHRITTLFDDLASEEEKDLHEYYRDHEDRRSLACPPDPLEIDPVAIKSTLIRVSTSTGHIFTPDDYIILTMGFQGLYKRYSQRVANEFWKHLTGD